MICECLYAMASLGLGMLAVVLSVAGGWTGDLADLLLQATFASYLALQGLRLTMWFFSAEVSEGAEKPR